MRKDIGTFKEEEQEKILYLGSKTLKEIHLDKGLINQTLGVKERFYKLVKD